jgi:hypothetical protein
MSISFKKNIAQLSDVVSVEDAEGLLEWLQKRKNAKIDLSACQHIHAANLQVLMAAKPTISAWPTDAALSRWLQQALSTR